MMSWKVLYSITDEGETTMMKLITVRNLVAGQNIVNPNDTISKVIEIRDFAPGSPLKLVVLDNGKSFRAPITKSVYVYSNA